MSEAAAAVTGAAPASPAPAAAPAVAPAATPPAAPATPAPAVAADPAPNPAAPPPAWLATLPAEMQGDPTLSRYQSVEALAQGHLETKRALSGKAGVAADVTPENWEAFALSRPAEATAYQIDVPEGQASDLADAFRAKAFEIGLHPAQAAELAQFNNQFVQQQQEKWAADSKAEADAWRSEVAAAGGNPDAQLTNVLTMMESLGIAGDAVGATIQDLELKIGSKATLTFLAQVASRVAELPALEGGDRVVDFRQLPSDQAQARFDALKQNPEWVKAANVEGTNERTQFNNLMAAIAGNRKR